MQATSLGKGRRPRHRLLVDTTGHSWRLLDRASPRCSTIYFVPGRQTPSRLRWSELSQTHAECRRPVPAPAARCPSPRPPAFGWATRSATRRFARPGRSCAGSPTINQFAKFLARFEEGDSLGWHFDSGSGSGIASDAPASLARLEVAESADFNLIPGSQSSHDAVKYDADEGVGFLPRHPNGSANLFAQTYPGHLVHPRRITKKSITGLPGARAAELSNTR